MPAIVTVSIMTTCVVMPLAVCDLVYQKSSYVHRLECFEYAICAVTLPPWSWLPAIA